MKVDNPAIDEAQVLDPRGIPLLDLPGDMGPLVHSRLLVLGSWPAVMPAGGVLSGCHAATSS